MKEVRAAVIGAAGAMGKAHSRVYSEIEGVKLVAVSDLNEKLGRAESGKYGCEFYPDFRQMLTEVRPDVVSVVVPTKLHAEVGCFALSVGRVVLVEKPIALDLEHARLLIQEAKAQNAILAIGHIERYNPTVQVVKRLLDYGEIGTPLKILFRREGPDPERIRDVNILIDIGTHDFDLARFLMGRGHNSVDAEGGPWRRPDLEDYASVRLTFKRHVRPPTIVTVELSWINKMKIRKIDITGSDGYISADLVRQVVVIATDEVDLGTYRDFEQFKRVSGEKGFAKPIPVPNSEPLKTELTEVVKAARGEPAELVTPEEGLAALSIALEATQQIRDKNKSEE